MYHINFVKVAHFLGKRDIYYCKSILPHEVKIHILLSQNTQLINFLTKSTKINSSYASTYEYPKKCAEVTSGCCQNSELITVLTET